MMDIKKLYKYYKEYQWSNIYSMIKNSRQNPKTVLRESPGQLAVITGATSGIGYHVARKYASKGINLICINRDEGKSKALCEEIEKEFRVKCVYKIADLSRLDDIHRVGNDLSRLETPIDVLIHNAGVYLTKRELTPDGLEKVFVVQYLASFVLNYLLMDKLKSQENARIILVNSEGHRFAAWGLRLDDLNWEKRRYSGLKGYGAAKLAQLLAMIVFADLFKHTGVTINAMHPGAVKTDTGQDNGPLYRWYKKNLLDKTLKPPEISAEALYYLGVSEDVGQVSGKFFNLTTEEIPSPPALDKEIALKLWELSVTYSGLKKTNPIDGLQTDSPKLFN